MKVVVRIFILLIASLLVNSCQTSNTSFLNFSQKSEDLIEFCPENYNDTSKYCNARGSYLRRSMWNFRIGALCYTYTNDYRLNFRYSIRNWKFICENETLSIPGTSIDDTLFWYDYTNETSLGYIKLSFKTEDFFKKWIDCCEEAVDCCDNHMTNENILPTDDFPCPAIWDGWSCFAPARANSIETLPCSGQAYSTTSSVCVLYSEKECFSNGTWNQQTNYQVCAIAPVLRSRHTFHVIVLSIGLVLMAPAVIILLSFQKFRKNIRLILHRNLIIAIMIRSILTIMSKELVILDALTSSSSGSNKIMAENGVPCRILAFFENVAKNAIYACMFVDGFYLHKLIVRAFANDPHMKYLYAVVIVLSFLPSLIWAILRGVKNDLDCWMVDYDGDQWVVDGFRMAILAINCILLLDILRVVVLKIRHGSSTQQTKATFRAMLFLIPLFGINIIVFADRSIVTSDTCYAEDVYYYASYFMEGFQGVMVALLFCYLSSEVQNGLKNEFRKFSVYMEQKYGFKPRRQTFSRRRTTAATYVGQDDFSNRKNSCDNSNRQSLNSNVKSGMDISDFPSNRRTTFNDEIDVSHI